MKRAFVFSGDGAKGGFQAGIVKALSDKGVQPDICYGTSSGAINSVGLAWLGVDGLCDVWLSIHKRSDVFGLNPSLLWSDGLFTSTPIRNRLETIISGPAKIPVVVTVVENATGLLSYHSSSDYTDLEFQDLVIGAITIPFVVKSTTPYVDGGCRIDAPLAKPIEDGCDEIIVILGSPPIANQPPSAPIIQILGVEFLGFAKMGLRFIDLMLSQLMMDDLRAKKDTTIPIRVFGPRDFLFDPLAFEYSAGSVEMGRQTYVEWVLMADGSWSWVVPVL